MIQRLKKWVLAPLAATAVFLLAGELIARWYFSRHIALDIEMARYATSLKLDSPNPLIGHLHRPNRSAHLMGVDVSINSDGFRDDEVPVERQAGRRRVIFLGDSLTFGWGVAKSDTFEALLEAQLSKKAPTDVINFGTGNYNTVQEANLFATRGTKYHPDHVVVFYFLNDAEPTPRKSRVWFFGYSRLLTFYWSRIQALGSRWSPSRRYGEYYSNLYREGQPGWVAATQAFAMLKTLCDRNGIGLEVVILPELHSLQPYPFEREHQLVTSFLAGAGIPCLDLIGIFPRDLPPRSLWVAPDDAHPNALAHKLIAEKALPFLQERIFGHEQH